MAAFFALGFSLLISCENAAGVGPIVDLTPPAINITSPAEFSYVPGEFEIRGDWADNIKVVKVVISDIKSGKEYGRAEINGNQWSLLMSIPGDGEYGLKATAYDKGGNTGTGMVTVFVDHTPPGVSHVALIRHDGLIPYPALKSLEELKTYDPDTYEQMDYFQNESVKIRARLDENRRIKNARLKLYEYDESSGSLILRLTDLPSVSRNPMVPEWELTRNMLTGVLPESASGLHYIKMAVEVFDEEVNAGRKDNSLGFFCWKAESDNPRIRVSREDKGKISVIQGERIDVTVFDDDDLGLIYAKTFTPAEWAGIPGTDNEKKLAGLWEGAAKGNALLGDSLLAAGNYRKRRENVFVYAPSNPGAYTLAIFAADRKMGNIPPAGSAWSGRAFDVEVKDPNTIPPFPDIKEITCVEPDGVYTKGSLLTFKLAFQDTIFMQSDAEKTAYIKFSGAENGDHKNKQVFIRPSKNSSGSGVLYFDYTIQSGDLMHNITIDDISLAGIVDRYGQTWKGGGSTAFSRPGLTVDAEPPKIIGFSPGKGGVMDAALNRKKIILTFSEPVFAETGGLIQVRPYGGWYIPPVLTGDEFRTLSQNTALTVADKKILTDVDSAGFPLGDPIKDKRNYYTKNTHGLDVSVDPVRPDLDSKYVLNFNLGLTGPEIEPLRDVFNKAKWKWQDLSAASTHITINGNQVTITLPRELERGREWELRIAPGSFRDQGGNIAAPLGWLAGTGDPYYNNPYTDYYPAPDATGEYRYHFWSPETEAPVIRVNRISYNGGNPMKAGYTQLLPDVDVPVRIDCETPGAVIHYGLVHKTGYEGGKAPENFQWDTGWGLGNESLNNANTRKNYTIPGAKKADFASMIPLTVPYGGPFYAGDKKETAVSGIAARAGGSGDGELYRARKDYVAARAERTVSPALAVSAPGYEGVFKTVIMFKHPYMPSEPLCRLRLSGENRTLAGFPFPQVSVFDENYGKDMYRIQDGAKYNYLWLSWEIVDSWNHIKSYGYNVNENSDVINENSYKNFDSGYGMLVYRYAVQFW
ncbi:MAG: hypothetical protein LBK02_06725 [Treponema sp.]|jgi:hypothetical protein|nr:hypothetical protein [Treponema sp.]